VREILGPGCSVSERSSRSEFRQFGVKLGVSDAFMPVKRRTVSTEYIGPILPHKLLYALNLFPVLWSPSKTAGTMSTPTTSSIQEYLVILPHQPDCAQRKLDVFE
jgi:hypothetical protein